MDGPPVKDLTSKAEGKQKAKGKGKGHAVLSSTRLFGKDADMAALVDGGGSDRFEAKKIGKRPLFRPILASPFNVQWPSIAAVDRKVILHTLLEVLQSEAISKGFFQRHNGALPRTSARKTKEKNKRRRMRLQEEVLEKQGYLTSPPIAKPEKVEAATPKIEETPPFLCGLNSVTRQMESLIATRIRVSEDAAAALTSKTDHLPRIIFVCQTDVDPASLVAHFPLLTATYNAVFKPELGCYLIALPEGSEQLLCEAINLRRCSVLSIDPTHIFEESESRKLVSSLLEKVAALKIADMRMDWLDKAIATTRGQRTPMNLEEPQVKHFRSSAPIDMNARKAAKKAARAERKEAKRVKKAEEDQPIGATGGEAKKRPNSGQSISAAAARKKARKSG